MAADVAVTVSNCGECARNRLKFRKRTKPWQLFPERDPLVSVRIDLLGPLARSTSGRRFLLVVTDRITKLKPAIPLRRMDYFTVARAFAEEWELKYGSPETVLSDNGSKFATCFFRRVWQVMG